MKEGLRLLYLDGYGIYVWPAYSLVLGALALQLFLPWKRWRQLRQKIKGAHAQAE